MAHFEKDEVPTLSETHAQHQSDEAVDSNFRRLVYRTRSASISIPMVSMDPNEREASLVGHTGPLRSVRKIPFKHMSGPLYATHGTGNLLHQSIVVTGNEVVESKEEKFSTGEGTDEINARKNEHLLRSGQLGMCNDPYCTTCPTYFEASSLRNPRASTIFDPKFHNALYGDAKGFGGKLFSFCSSYVPGVMNPHTKIVQQWNKFLAIFCLVAIFVDPLFFFLIYVQKDHKCIVINLTWTKILVSLRSVIDFLYFLNILLQFRLAYISPESRVVGAGDLVDGPWEIASNYMKGYFFLDFLVVLPFPQIMILSVLPNSFGLSGANNAKNLLRVPILVQYLPRLFRFLPLLIGQSPTGFIFESAWANFIINLLIFMLSGHVVGSSWYHFGLQRVNRCLQHAYNSTDAIACLNSTPSNDPYYGIYANAVELTIETKVVKKYLYSLFWGFQQISTLGGNLTPSKFELEVLFTMTIIGLGLLLFALLIGNIQNFLQALGRRRLEMQLRGRDVEQWMSHRRLPEDLRKRVRQAERYSWAATRGVNEEMLMENLPEDLQTDIRHHLFKFVKKVRIFALMDEAILDAICERLKQKTYIKGSRILSHGGHVEKMVFVVRGKLESIGENGMGVPLSEGDACGEELLTWYLEHSSVSTDGKKVRLPRQRLLSNRTVRCLTNVEAFSLRAADLEELTTLFTRFLRSPHVQGALRYESHYWRSLAANRIQVAWRYRKKCLSRANTSQSVQILKSGGKGFQSIMILSVLPNSLGSSGANYAKNLLRASILVQYIPRLFRFLPLLIGQSPTGFIFESAWANFIINLLIFMLSGHVVGSCWYLFGLQRVNQCLRDACHKSNIDGCIALIDCGHASPQTSALWINNTDAIACLDSGSSSFSYGIYASAVELTTETKVVNKYVFALFWGFQQISTLAGNLTPSKFVWEVLFTMAIIGLGLLLFALLIGNIQNFLQALGRRRLEMQLRGRDVEQWMSHRRLPEDLRRRVRQAERYSWAATRGVNEEMLLENLPEDLRTDIQRHLFKFVKKVRIFALMDEPILDAICERLKQKTYIKGSRILTQGGLVDKMVFVVRGKLESIGENGMGVPLSEGDACGEELLTWYLEHSSVSTDGRKVRLPGQRLLSNRTVRCLTNVEAFSLRAVDLEELTTLFTRFLRSPHVQGALRYESPYWRSLAANRIQVAWRYRKKRLSRAYTSQSG
ncbi:probable cyclic nucleotide-gated ion channel 20, chloroplastic isoform X1 [Gastrolobium bilobum]|uniref:probable cyclic nucleotide-gated ion channel 20, chloroplastic isoform X1 n=1 Tax=Gastrolobium bilobum TaxID=150636 RepID=UPI002AB0F3AE|nr:probable cyclic nucleotide-gated ion channel 20, chloroplastic isoform X1 [Gastrolobium bilobum]